MRICKTGRRFFVDYISSSNTMFFEIEDAIDGGIADIYVRDIQELQELSDLILKSIQKIQDSEEFEE